MGSRAVLAWQRTAVLQHPGGLSRHVIREFVDEWIVDVEDYTVRVRKIYGLLQSGEADKAKRHLPPERVYPLSAELGRRLLIETEPSRRSKRGN